MPPGACSTFFVAADGSDAWSGLLATANAERTDGPFATLRRARDAVRALRARGGAVGPVEIVVSGGKYYLDETLVLGPADGGSQDGPVTWKARAGRQVVLSGGRRVTNFTPWRGGIVRAELPWARGGKWKSRQLFCNGRRMPRARRPKCDPNEPIYSGWAFMEGPVEGLPAATCFRYPAGALPRPYAKPTELEVKSFVGPGWNMKTVPVRSIDQDRRVITLAYNAWDTGVFPWHLANVFQKDNRFCIENGLEDLERPGEWCFDSEDGVLYFWPPDGPVADCEVVVPVLDCLIDLSGTEWTPVAWVNVQGFVLTETLDGDNVHPPGAGGCGATAIPMGPRDAGNAVRLRYAEHCRVEGNCFRDVGGNAVYLMERAVRNAVVGNEISGAGANGVCLAGSRVRGASFNEVADNHIHHCGAINKYVAGVTLGAGDGNFVRHNRIEHLPHHGVNLGDNPNGRNYVEYNDIRWVCREIADTGAINAWMELPGPEGQRCGHVIRFNRIADIYGAVAAEGRIRPPGKYEHPTSGIYLDNCTSQCLVYGNLIVRCATYGVLIHGGRNNLVQNNVFVDCAAPVRFQDVITWLEYWKPMKGFMTGNLLRHNVCLLSRPDACILSLCGWTPAVLAESDQNVFFRPGGGRYRIRHAVSETEGPAAESSRPIETLAQWQALGFDRNSRFEDPRFVAPDEDDYRLSPDSPAIALGFQPIDTTRIGIRPQPAGPEERGCRRN